MKQQNTIILLAALVLQVSAAPQLISFNDGKLGVNFGGYHAAVGLGGILGNGAGGGLFAEAGTPNGQAARAGLGGAVDGNGSTAGGLFAGATAGGNVKASAGLSGGVTGEKAAGSGYASAQSGSHVASSGLGGDMSAKGASGFTFSGGKSFGVSHGVVKESEVAVKPIETEPVQKKVHKEYNLDAVNEVNFVPLASADANVANDVKIKEVHVESPPQVVEKHIVHTIYKPKHHLHKTAYIGGYVGSDAAASAPAIQKRIDIGVEGAANTGASADAAVKSGGAQEVYTKQVTFQRNPNFFADIFNIPISTLRAVGNFLGNAAGSTNVSVQKSSSIQSESDMISSKHAPLSSTSSDTTISVQTPSVSKVLDDIIAVMVQEIPKYGDTRLPNRWLRRLGHISPRGPNKDSKIPINTLEAVNKFLENNIPARKRIQVSEHEGEQQVEKRLARLGPHARRRAIKNVAVKQEESKEEDVKVATD